MAIMRLFAMVTICASLRPAMGQGQPAEALVASGGGGRWSSGWGSSWWPSWQPSWWPPRLRCKLGEVYKQCESSSCGERRCSQIGQPKPIGCTADCLSKCFCWQGLYRNAQGKCVFRWQCPQSRMNWYAQPQPRRGSE
uniref:TIL domain containing protein n=1 Tax=Rhipicephalus zambeziensis TaxID=60191 RepID=A0A224YRN8_9ACAR